MGAAGRAARVRLHTIAVVLGSALGPLPLAAWILASGPGLATLKREARVQ